MAKEKATYTKTELKGMDVEAIKKLDLYTKAKVKKSSTTKTAIINDIMAYQKKEADKLAAKIEGKLEKAKGYSAGKNKDLKKAIKFAQDAVDLGGGSKAESRLASYKAKMEKEEKAKAEKAAKKQAEKEAKENKSKDVVFHRPIRKRSAHGH